MGAFPLLVLLTLATACAGDEGASDTTSTAPRPSVTAADGRELTDAQAVRIAVQSSVDAESAKDAARFLSLWTDTGLAAYGQGSREEIAAGEHTLGDEPLHDIVFVEVDVEGNAATAVVDAVSGIGVYRLKFSLVNQGPAWLLDGFLFMGGPPPPSGKTVIDLDATEYEYAFDAAATATGDFAISFTNDGEEAHEASLFRIPARASATDARAALDGIDGTQLESVRPPQGYEVVGHIAFARPDESVAFTFAAPLEPGHYAFACYIPEGGFGASGAPVNPNGKPHIALGMLSDFTVG